MKHKIKINMNKHAQDISQSDPDQSIACRDGPLIRLICGTTVSSSRMSVSNFFLSSSVLLSNAAVGAPVDRSAAVANDSEEKQAKSTLLNSLKHIVNYLS